MPADSPTPFAPARLTRNEAQARTVVAQRVRQRTARIGDTAWDISLEPLAADAITYFGPLDVHVQAQWAGAPFELRMPASAADHWIRGRFPSLALPQLPPAIRVAALESALQDVLAALGAAGHGAARIEGMEDGTGLPGEKLHGHHFGLTLTCDEYTIHATLCTDAHGLMAMAALAAHWPVSRGPLARADVPVLLRAEVGTATLSREEIAALRPGDAIVLAHCWVDQDEQIWLTHEGWGLRVRADGPRLVVTSPFDSMEEHMDHETDEDIDDDSDDEDAFEDSGLPQDGLSQALDAVPVQLRFDLGQRTMQLGQVSELQVGQVLELTRPLSQAVSIRANGALIGTGELMDIGGRIAVGITSLGRAKGEQP